MFGFGSGEFLLLAIVALLVVGPEKLPHAAKSISSAIRSIRKQVHAVRETLDQDEVIGEAIDDVTAALYENPKHLSLLPENQKPSLSSAQSSDEKHPKSQVQ